MKHLIIFSIILFLSLPANAQLPSHEEVATKSNRIMKSIYNDIWRIRDRYPELKNFGSDNYSDTPELPSHYKVIKSIRIKSHESDVGRGFFKVADFRGDRDVLYICFSEGAKAFGTITTPTSGVKLPELGLYVLIYMNTDDQYLRHDIINIVRRNAVVLEQISY
ncbi:MAG: hypothetical protein WC546_05320 [Candidatus Omnitrophota bacterium]